MALQDLTPQLRTRLSRLERVVGIFVVVATILLVAGLAYYVYSTAERKGWFKHKVPYFTFVRSGTGLQVGDPIQLMGFPAGRVIAIEPQPPYQDQYGDVFVQFEIVEPYEGYIWEDSVAKVEPANFLGGRYIEITKGTNSAPTYIFDPYEDVTLEEARNRAGQEVVFSQEIWDDKITNYIVRAGNKVATEALDRLAEIGVTTIQIADKSKRTTRATGIWDEKAGK